MYSHHLASTYIFRHPSACTPKSIRRRVRRETRQLSRRQRGVGPSGSLQGFTDSLMPEIADYGGNIPYSTASSNPTGPSIELFIKGIWSLVRRLESCKTLNSKSLTLPGAQKT